MTGDLPAILENPPGDERASLAVFEIMRPACKVATPRL